MLSSACTSVWWLLSTSFIRDGSTTLTFAFGRGLNVHVPTGMCDHQLFPFSAL